MTAPHPAVLVVDDEPCSLSAMRMALEDDFDRLTAAEAGAALEIRAQDRVRVVLCDQRIPGWTGVELLTEEGERWPDTMRIMVAGCTDPAAMANAINEAGIHQVLTRLAANHGTSPCGFTPAAPEFPDICDWPGNLGELKAKVSRMPIFVRGPTLGADLISRPILPAPPGKAGADRLAKAVPVADGTLKDRVELAEMCILRETLIRGRWNKSRVGLRAKLQRFDIADPTAFNEPGRVPEEKED